MNKQASHQKSKNNIAILAICVSALAGGILGFWGGKYWEQTHHPVFPKENGSPGMDREIDSDVRFIQPDIRLADTPEDIHTLVALLTDPWNSRGRRQGVIGLAQIGCTDAAPVVRYLLDNDLIQVKSACLRYLGVCGNHDDVSRILPYAIWGRTLTTENTELIGDTSDEAVELRVEAMLAIGRLGTREDIQTLRETIMSDRFTVPGLIGSGAEERAYDQLSLVIHARIPIRPWASYRNWGYPFERHINPKEIVFPPDMVTLITRLSHKEEAEKKP